MDVIRCPHLGMPDDPDTRLDFPSPGNLCHKADPPGPIKLDYQQQTCLTGQHVNCPVYTAAQAIPVPAEILAPVSKASSIRRTPVFGRLPLALGLIVLLGLLLFAAANVLGRSTQNTATQGTGGQNLPGTAMFGLPQTGSEQLSVTPNPRNTQLGTACPPPEGWVTYTVNPTDSLYRLSVVHAVSVEALQRANCLGNETVILPGQVIYIPFTPTRTPTVTPSPTRFIPPSTSTPVPDDDAPVVPPTDEPEEPPTRVPPTKAPPTRAPTTAVPPTRAPTTAVPPTRAPTTPVPPTRVPPTAVPPTDPPTEAPTVVPTEEPTSSLPPILQTLLPTFLPPIDSDGD